MNGWEQPQLWEAPVALTAGFPDEQDDAPLDQVLEIEEALLSFTRAAFAQRRRLLLPADRVVAPFVAQVAAEYAAPTRTEVVDAPPRLVQVVLTEGRDEELTELLADLGQAQMVLFGPVDVAHPSRHRLTYEAVRELRPASAVVLGGAPQTFEDVLVLREARIPLEVVGPTLAGSLRENPELLEYDITRRLLDADVERAVPYPYLMQRLVDEWGESSGRRV